MNVKDFVAIVVVAMLFVLIGILSTIASKLKKDTCTTTYEHPAIHSPIEVFVIPLNDTLGDICCDTRLAKVSFPGSNVTISQRCPVDSNRWHVNIILTSYKKEQ